ncbi:MAG TPA: hypothetical protein VFW19_01200, partial [Allosphingosinicella sp.]|nr:hypothetical protein [Allosphingosinicella sp.]
TNLWTVVQQSILRKRLGPLRPPGSEPAPGLGELLKRATQPREPAPATRGGGGGSGGACPVDPDALVRVTVRNGVVARHAYPARQLHWGHRGRDNEWDIAGLEILADGGRGVR